MIAALVEQARERGIPVMVVTGDRDAYQLVGDGVRIMTTSRGITDTKVYDREGVIERYGIPPELIPDFIGLKGDTSDNIPGVPGIGDKTASELLQRFGDLEARARQRRRDLRRQAQAEPGRARRRGAALQAARDDGPRRPDRPRPRGRVHARSRTAANLRTVFRDWELRDPLRRLEEALFAAEAEAIPRPEAAEARTVPVRTGATPADVAQARGRRAVPRRGRARGARGRADPARAALALRRLRRRRPGAGRRDGRPGRARRRGRRPARRRPRRQGARRRPAEPRLRHRARRLPARPRAPRLPARRAVARSAAWPSTPTTRTPPAPSSIHDLAAQQREQLDERGLTDLLNDIELPLVHVLRETEKVGDQARHAAAGGGREPHPHRRGCSSSARSGRWPARSS